MAQLKCICGTQLSNCRCPNETEGIILRDIDIERFDPEGAFTIDEIGRGVWECHACGRLAINYPSREACTVKWYRPENGEPGAMMAFDSANGDYPTPR
jgi:hypothetical protein